MSDTTTLNTISNYLRGDTLKVSRTGGQWTVSLGNGWSEVQSTRSSLREALGVITDHMKKHNQ